MKVKQDVPQHGITLVPFTTSIAIVTKGCKDFRGICLGSVDTAKIVISPAMAYPKHPEKEGAGFVSPFWQVEETDDKAKANCTMKDTSVCKHSWKDGALSDTLVIPVITNKRALAEGEFLEIFKPKVKQAKDTICPVGGQLIVEDDDNTQGGKDKHDNGKKKIDNKTRVAPEQPSHKKQKV